MTNRIEVTRTLLATDLLAKDLAERGRWLRERAAALMGAELVNQAAVQADDGTDFGTITLASGRNTAKVVDERALIAWMRDQDYGHEIVEAVRPSFLKRLQERAIDGEDIPGIGVERGRPYVTVKPTEAARLAIAQAMVDSTKAALAAAVEAPEADEATDGEVS
jgi:hypothetical protein